MTTVCVPSAGGFLRRGANVIVILIDSLNALAQEKQNLTFRPNTIDASNVNSAGAAIDVNKDGKTDIVIGGVWYEAPAWKVEEHFRRIAAVGSRLIVYYDSNYIRWIQTG